MAFQVGEGVQFGVAVETTRGTPVSPAIWFPARAPATVMAVVDKVDIKESRGNGIMTQATEIAHTHAAGSLEFNLRNVSIGYLLKSLIGSVTPVTALGATTHTFSVLLNSAQHPSLTLALAQSGTSMQDYQYPLSLVDSMEFKFPVDDAVQVKANFIATAENTIADYTAPTFTTTDVLFRPQDVLVKFASTTAGLGAASAICLKDLSLAISNNARVNQCIGLTNPSDILTMMMEISGSFTVDYADATTNYAPFLAGTYQAMQITCERDDLAVLGTSALYPKMEIILPKVSFQTYKATRPIDDIVTEVVGFKAHYDTTAAKAISITLQNTTSAY